MLEHNPTPTLDEMVEFTQRYRALGCSAAAETLPVQVDAVSRSSSDSQLKELFTMVAGIAAKQQTLEDRLKHGFHLVRPPILVPAIHVVYKVILLGNARDSEALLLGGTCLATTAENQATSRESVNQRVL